jgi:hypothetical protein
MNTPEDLARRAEHFGKSVPGYLGCNVVGRKPTILKHTFSSNQAAEQFLGQSQLEGRNCWIDDKEPNAVCEQMA